MTQGSKDSRTQERKEGSYRKEAHEDETEEGRNKEQKK